VFLFAQANIDMPTVSRPAPQLSG